MQHLTDHLRAGNVVCCHPSFTNPPTYYQHPSIPPPPSPGSRPTFNGDDMLPDLVLQQRLLHPLQQLVDRVDVGVHGLEPLDLISDSGRVGKVLLVVHGWSSRGRRRRWNLWPPAASEHTHTPAVYLQMCREFKSQCGCKVYASREGWDSSTCLVKFMEVLLPEQLPEEGTGHTAPTVRWRQPFLGVSRFQIPLRWQMCGRLSAASPYPPAVRVGLKRHSPRCCWIKL